MYIHLATMTTIDTSVRRVFVFILEYQTESFRIGRKTPTSQQAAV